MGAGASYDAHMPELSGSLQNPAMRFPLARDLFSASFWSLAGPYDGVQFLAPRLASAAQGDTFSLEEALREISDDPDPEIRRAFKQIPLYIRDVICECQEHYIEIPSAHIRLVDILRPGYKRAIAFITANYDTLIERALGMYSPRFSFSSVRGYLGADAPVLKLHGSIDWFVPVGEAVPETSERDSWWQALNAADLSGLDP